MDLAEALARHSALATLPGPLFDALRDAMTLRAFPDGHVYMAEGDADQDVWILLSGEVRVTRMQGRVEVGRLGPGAFFGLVALVDDGHRSATCTGVGPTRAASIPVSACQLLLASHAPLALAVQETVATQLAADFRRVAARLAQEMGHG